MIDVLEIYKSWVISFNPTEEQKETSDYRISVCNNCPHKLYVNNIDTWVCELCYCPLHKKIFSPKPGEEACPKKYWKK